MADNFKLPGSSYEEIIKIIKAYSSGKEGQAQPLDAIAQASGIDRTIVSRNNGFLLQMQLLMEGAKKTPTSECFSLGTVTVTVDRPLGSYHPEYKDMYYPINYGYIEGVMAPDGEEQDAYILGVNEPVGKFTGEIIAIVYRKDDIEEKWVVVPDGVTFSKEEIRR